MVRRFMQAVLLTSLGVALATVPITPAAAATSHVSAPIVCESGYWWETTMRVHYTVESGHRLSINRVEMRATGGANFLDARVARHYSSDGTYLVNKNREPINAPTAVFYWPIEYHVATTAAKANVDTNAYLYIYLGGVRYEVQTGTCRGWFWA